MIYVLDVSGSTDLNFLLQNNRPRIDANGNGILGDAGDDFNGDGELGDVLDGEIAGVPGAACEHRQPDAGERRRASPFATNAAAADVSPTLPNSGGITQVYATPPQVDVNGINGARHRRGAALDRLRLHQPRRRTDQEVHAGAAIHRCRAAPAFRRP